MLKNKRNISPYNHDQFKCFGPIATKDGEFDNTYICDLGCFNQDGSDTNKFYHCAVVQHSKSSLWFVYCEWGRTGDSHKEFQFYQCDSKEEAQSLYCNILHKKNDKRGEWYTHPSLGVVLRAKENKDCYLVRPQSQRNTGLPDAQTIKTDSPVPKLNKQATTSQRSDLDDETQRLLNDLQIGTASYTRSSMSNNCIPTVEAIKEAQLILDEATKRINKLRTADERKLLQDKELVQLTKILFSRIPKEKNKGDSWILTPDRIQAWNDDLNAFESASISEGVGYTDILSDRQIRLRYIDKRSKLGQWLYEWWPTATRNKHGYISGQIKPIHIWEIIKDAKFTSFNNTAKTITGVKTDISIKQPDRIDLDTKLRSIYSKANINVLFHGTKSVNVGGILQEDLRLPNTLPREKVTAWAFGPGCYWASDIKKSVGYTSMPGSFYGTGQGQIKSRQAFMFIGDVILGKPYVVTYQHHFLQPPDGCHSVFANPIRNPNQSHHEEFIVYNTQQHYLRYLVEFSQ